MKTIVHSINFYKKELNEMVKELQTMPEGHLQKSGTSYKQRIGNKDIGISKNKPLIQRMCRKRFLIVRIKQSKHNISTLSGDFGEFDFATPQEIIKNLPTTYQDFPKNYFYHPSIESWIEQPVHVNSYPMESGWSYSNNGIPLRSKSETFIANMLEKYDLPYHYDIATKLGNKTIYPDFLVKNPYTGKATIWEHFGALHDSEYEKKMDKKMAHYLDSGLIPLETMIYTFESDAKRPERLKYLIEKIIL